MNYRININRLSLEMLSKGYSISKLSKISGLSKSTISRVIKSKGEIRVETIFKIAKALDLEVRELIS